MEKRKLLKGIKMAIFIIKRILTTYFFLLELEQQLD